MLLHRLSQNLPATVLPRQTIHTDTIRPVCLIETPNDALLTVFGSRAQGNIAVLRMSLELSLEFVPLILRTEHEDTPRCSRLQLKQTATMTNALRRCACEFASSSALSVLQALEVSRAVHSEVCLGGYLRCLVDRFLRFPGMCSPEVYLGGYYSWCGKSGSDS